jgi:GMP synthase-like glutamine amidotransferase/tetratricopeptide (TPR) repeat protein
MEPEEPKMTSLRTLVLEHWWSDSFRVFGEVLDERGIEADSVHVDEAALPNWRDYDLIVALGGPMSVYEEAEYPWLVDERRLIREAVAAGVPYFGVCFGAQLLASALGANVYRGPAPELGLSPVFLTEAAWRDPIFRGFPRYVEVFEWHRDAFDLPDGAVRLARSPRYGNQAMRFGRVAYGIQCHFEKSAPDIARALEITPSFLHELEERHGRGAVDSFLDGYATVVPSLQETARQLLRRWLELGDAVGGGGRARKALRRRSRGSGLVARQGEQAQVEGLLAAARGGGCAALVVRGDPGLGKTALLEWAVAHARGMRVLRAAGVESDAELPFSGLRQLCDPVLDRIDALSLAQRAVLAAAIAPDEGAPPGDRFAVDAAFGALLAEVASDRSVIVVVDDAHWLDEATVETLVFAVRHGVPRSVAFLLATGGDELRDLAGAQLTLDPLDRASMRTILGSCDAVLEQAVADAVIATADGNPLSLLELVRTLTPAQRSGEENSNSLLHPRASAEEAFLHRIARLPLDTRRALVLAALAEDADVSTLARAGREFGIKMSAFQAAASAALVVLTPTHVVFSHPLVRTAVVYHSPLADRQEAHAALAAALTASSERDRRAWHLARAANGQDETAAAALDDAARRAIGGRAYGAAARALEFAARLTPDRETRAQRLLAAAGAAFGAGHVAATLDHLDAARRLGPSEALLADIDHLRGRAAARTGSAAHARSILVAGARSRESADPSKAASMLADAVLPCLRSGLPGEACEIAQRAVELAMDADGPTRVRSILMHGTALIFTGDFERGREAVGVAADLAEQQTDTQGELRAYLARGLRLAGYLDRARDAFAEVIAAARTTGALGHLPYALARAGDLELECGQWTEARRLLDEAIRLARETGQGADEGLGLGTLAWLDAAQGRHDNCRDHLAAASSLASRLGTGSQLDRAGLARGLLELGSRNPTAAVPHFEETLRQQHSQGWSDAAVPPHVSSDLVEAYVLARRRSAAAELLADFDAAATRSGRPSALAASARCRAILERGEMAEGWFEKALAIGNDGASSFEVARTRLRYAEHLSRTGADGRGRSEAVAALETFEILGATPWAAQARDVLA